MHKANDRAKIIVLTPIKNEAWGIENFLKLVTMFADLVIVLDQNSSDDSLLICNKFSNVFCFNNPSDEYDEGYRQRLLIDKARELVHEKKLLIALDVDEFPDAQSLNPDIWEDLRYLDKSTALYFQKPDIFLAPLRMESPGWYLMGYMDDGVQHKGLKVHSERLPSGSPPKRIKVSNIHFLHLACARENEYRARQACYAMTENISQTKNCLMRNWYYSSRTIDRRYRRASIKVPDQWVNYPDIKNLIENTPSSQFNEFHLKCLFLLSKYGYQRFNWDDVWKLDWNGAWNFYSSKYPELMKPKIPNNALLILVGATRRVVLFLFGCYLSIKMGARSAAGKLSEHDAI